MAKTLEVKRFSVMYKGELFGPKEKNGSIIVGVDDVTAKKLIKDSGGYIIEQEKAKKDLSAKKEVGNKDINKKDDGENNLPAIEPSDTTGKK